MYRSETRAILSLLLSGFFKMCRKPARPKNKPPAMATISVHSVLNRDSMPAAPIEMFAKPSSFMIMKLSSPLIWKISLAVNAGFVTWRMPAMNSLTPTDQKTNHLPMSDQPGDVLCGAASMPMEMTGSISMKSRTLTK